MEPYKYFTKEDFKEFNGFDIFESDWKFSFQRSDDDDIFVDDQAAWNFVWVKAQEGSKVHQKIINYIKEYNREEYDWFARLYIKINLF